MGTAVKSEVVQPKPGETWEQYKSRVYPNGYKLPKTVETKIDELNTELSRLMAVQTPLVISNGRTAHIAGTMNKLEGRYAEHLEGCRLAGEIAGWKFEPFKLRLARSTFFDIDFMVRLPDGALELHEVKGHWEDDARVKIKVAAKMFTEFRFLGVRWDKEVGWKFEEFKA